MQYSKGQMQQKGHARLSPPRIAPSASAALSRRLPWLILCAFVFIGACVNGQEGEAMEFIVGNYM